MATGIVPETLNVRTMLLLAFSLLLAAGCSTLPPPQPPPAAVVVPPPPETKPPPKTTQRERRSEDYAIIIAEPADSYESLAETYFGDRKLSYLISEFNNDAPVVAGKDVVIPLKPVNPGGLTPGGYQTVPVLCYHKFSPKVSTNKIDVSADTFDRQMAYLKNNGYNVISLRQLHDFIEYRQRLPKKSVLITIDDGWKTVRTIAYPILKKYGYTAVLFVYTDLIKNRPSSVALSWDDVKEMADSGVIEIESHTVTHSDLTKISEEKLAKELKESQRIIMARIGKSPQFLAYPYGNFNDDVVAAMKELGYKAGFTVIRGSNAFFYNNYSLSRSMVYNSEKTADFARLLETSQQD